MSEENYITSSKRNIEFVDQPDHIEVEDQNEVNFVFLEHAVIDSLIFSDIYEKMVYIVLKRFANFNSKEGWPSIKRLAQLAVCSENKVRSSLKKLEEKALIKVTIRKTGDQNLSNKYTILKITEELKAMNYKNLEDKEEKGVLHHVKGGTSPREAERKIIKDKNNKKKNNKESIYLEQIKQIDLPFIIKKTLVKKIDRLILFKIDLDVVYLNYEAVNSRICDGEFAQVLDTVLTVGVKSNFNNLMQTAIQRYLENRVQKQAVQPQPMQPKSSKLPDWLHDEETPELSAEQLREEEENQKWLENLLQNF